MAARGQAGQAQDLPPGNAPGHFVGNPEARVSVRPLAIGSPVVRLIDVFTMTGDAPVTVQPSAVELWGSVPGSPRG
jgi:hypothetical protein